MESTRQQPLRREINDYAGRPRALSKEVFVISQKDAEISSRYREGMLVQLIAGVDNSPTPGHHFQPGWVTVCRLDAEVAEFVGFKRKNITEITSMDGNQFHRFIEMLPPWQKDYIREFKRTSGKEAGFEAAGGGWYVLSIEGALPSKVRMKQVLAMTEALKKRPDAQAGQGH